MREKVLSVFVDESGKFQYPDAISRFYIVSLVLHNQDVDISKQLETLDSDWVRMGYEDFWPLERNPKMKVPETEAG